MTIKHTAGGTRYEQHGEPREKVTEAEEFDGDRHALADHLRDVHGLADEVHEIVFHHQGMEQEMLGDLHQVAHGGFLQMI